MRRTRLALLVVIAAAAAATAVELRGEGGAVADPAAPREAIGVGGGPGLPPPAALGPGGAGRGKVTGVTVSGHSVLVKLRCAGVSGVRCALVLTLSAGQAGRRVTIGRATATLAGGAHKVATVGLNGTGRRLLATDGTLSGRLTVTQGRKSLVRRAVTLTRKA